MVDHGTGRGRETPPPQRGVRGAEAPRPADTPSTPATRWAKIGVEEKRESAPEGPWRRRNGPRARSCERLGDRMSLGFLFPLFGCGFLLFFLTGGWGPTMTG